MTGTACVLHGTLNSVGGSARVALHTLDLLHEMGYKTILVAVETTKWDRVHRITGINVRADEERPVFPFKVRYFGIYARLLTAYKLSRLKKKGLCDLTINTHGDVLPVGTDITYMHYPTFAIFETQYVNEKYSKSWFWKLYIKPYIFMQKRILSKFETKVLVTNSEYSKQAIIKYMGIEPMVVYPPVDIDDFLKVAGNRSREYRVVSCGRYSPEKRYEDVLRIAGTLRGVEFTIIGSISGKVSRPYVEKLRETKKRLRLDNVNIMVDVPREEQIEIYGKSMVFLHPMRGEHFGIAVVEAMASGLVPVVHKSGGAWLDIVNRGMYGFGFDEGRMASAVMNALLSYDSYRDKAVSRARMFDKNVFKSKMKEIIEGVSKR